MSCLSSLFSCLCSTNSQAPVAQNPAPAIISNAAAESQPQPVKATVTRVIGVWKVNHPKTDQTTQRTSSTPEHGNFKNLHNAKESSGPSGGQPALRTPQQTPKPIKPPTPFRTPPKTRVKAVLKGSPITTLRHPFEISQDSPGGSAGQPALFTQADATTLIATATAAYQKVKKKSNIHSEDLKLKPETKELAEWTTFELSPDNGFKTGVQHFIDGINQHLNYFGFRNPSDVFATPFEVFPGGQYFWTISQDILSEKDVPVLAVTTSGAMDKGSRPENEDVFFDNPVYQNDPHIQTGEFYSVFDGHGGVQTASQAQAVLRFGPDGEHPQYLSETFSKAGNNPYLFLQLICHDIALRTRENEDGAVFAMAYVDQANHLVWTATLGDSKVMIARKFGHRTKLIPCGKAIDWSIKEEAERVQRLGLKIQGDSNIAPWNHKCTINLNIMPNGQSFSVSGEVFQKIPNTECHQLVLSYLGNMDFKLIARNTANSRAIGDSCYRKFNAAPAVLTTPEIACAPIESGDTILVFTDGLSNQMFPQVISIINNAEKKMVEDEALKRKHEQEEISIKKYKEKLKKYNTEKEQFDKQSAVFSMLQSMGGATVQAHKEHDETLKRLQDEHDTLTTERTAIDAMMAARKERKANPPKASPPVVQQIINLGKNKLLADNMTVYAIGIN